MGNNQWEMGNKNFEWEIRNTLLIQLETICKKTPQFVFNIFYIQLSLICF